MIEMEKETVLPGDGGQKPVGHLQSQRLAGCSNGSLTAVAVSSGGATMTALAGTVAVPEHSAVNVTSVGGQRRAESAGSGAQMAGRPMRPKNGQHQPQQQKLHKRRYSMNASFKQSGYGKRRRRANSESDPVLPTNFLLGGNIFDPLNLNSLLDEEVNRTLNAETPKSSPLPAKSRDPVEILIPKDITDPLNLNSAGGKDDILVSPMKSRKRHRNRHHGGVGGMPAAQMDSGEIERGKAGEGCVAALTPSSTAVHAVPEAPREGAVLVSLTSVLESPQPYELNTSINCRDEVVAPILPCRHSHKTTSIPQKSQSKAPGSSGCLTSVVSCQPPSSRHRKRRRTSSRTDASSIPPTPSTQRGSVEQARGHATRGRSQTFHTPLAGGAHGHATVTNHHGHQRSQNRRKERKFQYGNYSKYYGYRNPGLCEDPRMRVLRSEWFRGKVVLDLGCNTGHLTLSIAKNMQPARILGLDIDGGLVRAARHNIRHFLSELQTQEARRGPRTEHREQGVSTEPHGSVDMEAEGVPSEEARREPFSASYFPLSLRICRGPIAAPPIFVTGNEEFPANVTFVEENYVLQSDALLQAQQPEYDVILCLSLTKWVHLNWGDAGLQRVFKRAFRQLRPGGLFILEPQPWSSYGRRKKLTDTIYKNYYNIRLKPDQFSSYLTSEVGFSSYELIGTPKTMSKGFLRAIYLFHKGPSSYRK
ncbi:7SK snRNA methylphosphate capping enzyme-like isoform X2 [Brienomyrus brachyistius]|uniref:7SK snRNA methylphosphate capping enzyme-like isoform X2 n=1 Tax=Brienomyrus brachyistius TaxID=42636 RepID=UPI0020B37037|nr:7SK snRNA methylphosphate capping enzyme-like isoform X2 [Brienomyrus brachyistius]